MNGFNFVLITPEIILAIGALALLLLEVVVPRPHKVWLAGFTAAVFALALATLPGVTAVQGPALGGMVTIDGLGTFFRATFLVAGIIVSLTSARFVLAKGMAVGEFYSLLLMATVGALFMATAADVVSFYVGLETLSLSSYPLAGFLLHENRSLEASIKYFLNGALASALLLFGLSLAYGLTNTTSIAGIAAGLVAPPAGAAQGGAMALVALALVLAGLAFKVAAVPFHLWASDTYEGSPTPVAAFLSVVSKGAALAAFIRVVLQAFQPLLPQATVLLAVLAVLTMTVGNVAALWQKNVKRLLAYSSIAHAGYILGALAIAGPQGFSVVLFYTLAYTFMNLGAFAVLAALAVQGEGDDLPALNGLARRSPWLAAVLTLFLASLLGIPLTGGFMAKLFLFDAAVTHQMLWLALVIAINTGISAYYYFQVVRHMYVVPGREQARAVPVDPLLSAGLAVSALGVLWLGILPEQVFRWALAAGHFFK